MSDLEKKGVKKVARELIKGFSLISGILILITLYSSMADLKNADAMTSRIDTPAKDKFSCAIAKSAYGSPGFDEPIRMLRTFRDKVLMGSALGRRLANVYYRFSGPFAHQLEEGGMSGTSLKWAIRAFLFLVKYLEAIGLGIGILLTAFFLGMGKIRAVKTSPISFMGTRPGSGS